MALFGQVEQDSAPSSWSHNNTNIYGLMVYLVYVEAKMFHGGKSCLPERVMLVRTSSAVGKPTNNCVGVLVACASKICYASHFYEKYDADLLWNLTPIA